MIQIIKLETKRNTECPMCGCLFSFDECDIEYGTQLGLCNSIECPQCGNIIDLENNKNKRDIEW